MPCIKRLEMPQVDLADYPALFAYLGSKDILVSHRILPVRWFTMFQCMEDTHAATRAELLHKPLLVSMDLGILDGNGRLLQKEIMGINETECFQLNRSFAEAKAAILTFPKAYTLASEGPNAEWRV